MGRPKGSKTKKRNAYAGRTDRIRAKYGKKCYRRWGKHGGNPALLKDKGSKTKGELTQAWPSSSHYQQGTMW